MQGSVPMDDEEDVDDDTFDDFVDPWGIISLPLKVEKKFILYRKKDLL